jgi:hypothetical protein
VVIVTLNQKVVKHRLLEVCWFTIDVVQITRLRIR